MYIIHPDLFDDEEEDYDNMNHNLQNVDFVGIAFNLLSFVLFMTIFQDHSENSYLVSQDDGCCNFSSVSFDNFYDS